MMEVLEHEHPLKLIDMQLNDEAVKESDEEEEEKEMEKDLFTQDEFVCPCKRCDQPIHWYYRYYYKCIDDSCDYYLHKFCAEVPTTLKHTSHSHPLTLTQGSNDWICDNCVTEHEAYEVSFRCPDSCFTKIDVCCVVELDKKRIHHPSHSHPLVCLFSKPILYGCNACGKEHKGIFFLCTTCSNFAIHADCAFLPKRLLIQQTTNDIFHHTHPLTLSYAFPRVEQNVKYNPKCRVCDHYFWKENLWIYKCEKCIYYVHVDCATLRREPFMSIISSEKGRLVKNFKDGDYPGLFHLPFPDQSYNILRQLFFEEIGPTTYGNDKVSLQHPNNIYELLLVEPYNIGFVSFLLDTMKKRELLCNGCVRPIMEMPFYKCGANEYNNSGDCNFVLHLWCTQLPTKVDNQSGHPQHTSHHHELVLVNRKCIDGASSSSETSSLMMCHNPMKKIELLCNACLRPIMEMPFYKCGANSCNFALHDWCTRLPTEVHNHPGHLEHTLILMSNVPGVFFNIFDCDVCHLPCNGYAYGCVKCKYYVDVTCGFIPKNITHKSHPDHILSIVKWIPFNCIICNYYDYPTRPLGYSCRMCDVYIHTECALSLPETIRHAYDKHPLKLSYLPIENHKSEYFCEVCEWELNPHSCFYHCGECAQSVHPACAPLILCCETETHSSYRRRIYQFINVKFGSIQNIYGHPHPLLFAQGIESDGQCSMCSSRLQYKMIYKCVECKFAIDYKCLKEKHWWL